VTVAGPVGVFTVMVCCSLFSLVGILFSGTTTVVVWPPGDGISSFSPPVAVCSTWTVVVTTLPPVSISTFCWPSTAGPTSVMVCSPPPGVETSIGALVEASVAAGGAGISGTTGAGGTGALVSGNMSIYF
ncbi:hypothetical protein L916_08264, partial [Phytophthora nicotianae]